MVETFDSDIRPVRRLVAQPVASRYRDMAVVDDFSLPRLFSESFGNHRVMQRSTLPWYKLPSYCGSLEDSPYLEQKFASLMAAVEFFTRTSLIEAGLGEDRATRLEFTDLIGAARRDLGWVVPRHYRSGQLTRLVRNAVVHGSTAPTGDDAQFRWLFDKWRLFLFRRILIRVGYRGEVRSPFRGFLDSSAVDDFSEERNSFEPDESGSHPFMQLAEFIRQHLPPEGGRDSDSS
jgi:hypothetical protein